MKKIPTRQITATAKEPAVAEPFSIRDIKQLLAGRDMLQELHRHDFFYLLALEKGAGVHEIDFTPYTICNHSIFLMHPGQVHRLRLKAGSKGYLVQFKAGFYYPHDKASNHLLRRINTLNCCRFSTSSFQKPLSVLTDIYNEYNNRPEKYQEVIRANLDILLIELIRQDSKNSSSVPVSYTRERLEEFIELVDTHFATHKQVSWYASRMNLTPYQLNAISKTSFGKTCSQVITEHILLEAKRYLLATTNQVNEIAWQLGYEDVSYFIRFFKKQTGFSPEQFRLNSR